MSTILPQWFLSLQSCIDLVLPPGTANATRFPQLSKLTIGSDFSTSCSIPIHRLPNLRELRICSCVTPVFNMRSQPHGIQPAAVAQLEILELHLGFWIPDYFHWLWHIMGAIRARDNLKHFKKLIVGGYPSPQDDEVRSEMSTFVPPEKFEWKSCVFVIFPLCPSRELSN